MYSFVARQHPNFGVGNYWMPTFAGMTTVRPLPSAYLSAYGVKPGHDGSDGSRAVAAGMIPPGHAANTKRRRI